MILSISTTTGGVRRQAVAEDVLASGVAMVGMATALALVPDLPEQWRAGRHPSAEIQPIVWKDKALAALASMALVKRRLRALGAGRSKPKAYSPLLSTIIDQLRTRRLTRRYRSWRAAHAEQHWIAQARRPG
jgi:hypothetical protein